MLHRRHVVAHKEDCATGLGHIAHLAHALLLKRDIADGEHFVHQQDFRFEVRRDGEG